jgi:hypothetical protein
MLSETGAVFFQLMRAAMSVNSTMTEEDFLQLARDEFAKHIK